jgi:hypothetical protein
MAQFRNVITQTVDVVDWSENVVAQWGHEVSQPWNREAKSENLMAQMGMCWLSLRIRGLRWECAGSVGESDGSDGNVLAQSENLMAQMGMCWLSRRT